SNYALYGDMSNRVYRILQNYTPDVCSSDLDECFLHFNNFADKPLDKYCKKLRQEVLQKTLIPTCVGIAQTKALAKVANHIAKKFPELEGVYLMDTDEKRIKALRWLDRKSVV